MKRYSLVVAIGPDNVIGDKKSLIWHSKCDFDFFKYVTCGKACIFGDVTFFNLPKYPLKNRLNIVASLQYTDVSLEVNENGSFIKVPTVEDGFVVSENFDEVVICGGRSIYEYVLKYNLVDKIYFSTITSQSIEKTIKEKDECDLIRFPVDLEEYCNGWNKLEMENYTNCIENDMTINFKCYSKY